MSVSTENEKTPSWASGSGSTAGFCGGCQRGWKALGAAHCSACHLHFTSDSAFDRHRTGKYDESRRCMVVGELQALGKNGKPRLVETARGWATSVMSDEQKAARFGAEREATS